MSSLVFSLGLSAALAGPAGDIAAQFHPDAPPPDFGLACDPIRQAVQLADALGTFSADSTRPEFQMLLDAARDPSIEAVDGVDVDGGFTMVFGKGGSSISLPTKGDLRSAIGLFGRDDEASWEVDGVRARRVEADGSVQTLSVDGRHARLTMVPGVPAQRPATSVTSEALLRLPDAPGCALWTSGLPRLNRLMDAMNRPMALWVPFDDRLPMQLNMALPPHRDRAEVPTVRPPLEVSSPAQPQAVITLGVPLMSIIRDPVVQRALPGGIRDKLPEPGMIDELGAGMVVGTFLGPNGPSVVGVIPIETDSGRPVSARRIWKVTEAALAQFQSGRQAPAPVRIGRRALEVQVTPKRSVVILATRGRVYVGNVRSQVESMATGSGEAWLSPEQVEWSSTHAVALFADAPIPGLRAPMEVTFGARMRGDLMNAQLRISPGLGDPEVAAALRSFATERMNSEAQKGPVRSPR